MTSVATQTIEGSVGRADLLLVPQGKGGDSCGLKDQGGTECKLPLMREERALAQLANSL